MRNAEVGTRNSRVRSGAARPALMFRVPRSAFPVCLFFAACTPVTTRPAFFPDPRALVVVLNARPERVTMELRQLVPAESLEVARSNVLDGYVETAWYDTRAHRTLHRHREDPLLGRSLRAGPDPPHRRAGVSPALRSVPHGAGSRSDPLEGRRGL